MSADRSAAETPNQRETVVHIDTFGVWTMRDGDDRPELRYVPKPAAAGAPTTDLSCPACGHPGVIRCQTNGCGWCGADITDEVTDRLAAAVPSTEPTDERRTPMQAEWEWAVLSSRRRGTSPEIELMRRAASLEERARRYREALEQTVPALDELIAWINTDNVGCLEVEERGEAALRRARAVLEDTQ